MALPDTEFDGVDEPQITVLHVDDEPEFSELVALQLERLDDCFTVVTARNARDGFEALTDGEVDAVVSDYQMPVTNGIEFLRTVREDYPNLPFFLFTGQGSEEIATDAIDAGVTSYIQKGGTEVYEQLVNRIRNAVGYRRSVRRAEITRNRLLELYEQTDGFFVVDSAWTITYWNEQMVRRTGRTADEVLGRSLLDEFPEADGTELYDNYREAMTTRADVAFETYFEPHDYWLHVRVYPVDEGLFVHSREITGEKEREQELQRRNHILESFANTVSHDLRNPLNIAEGKVQLAQKTGDFEHLDAVAEAHNRMRNLIDELLQVARGEESVATGVSLAGSAERAWATVSSEEMDLVIEGDAAFESRESQLRRLFENLFWNALDHGGASTVRVGVTDGDGFYVADDGVGIPPADRECVFESGFSTEDGNPGYGLAIVDRICETHGWEIGVTEGVDGARFEITDVGMESVAASRS
ncbi:response regulator [Halosimplex amylolyticum]|uniref:sensor histidine kinase n=1 Tax=Halosimplex amylolyticum TaxID=3396616 RepID=UPI003F559215